MVKLAAGICLFFAFVGAICRFALQRHPTSADVVFAKVDGRELALDLYMPDSYEEAPNLVVFIHGGGWQKGSKKNIPVRWLADEGFAVASISYRLTDTAQFPAQIHDCKGAIRWLRAHASDYGFRADRIVVSGSSAGGHLAALLGTSAGVDELEGEVGGNTDQSSRVQGVIDYYGATDFVLRSRTQPDRANEPGSVVALLLGGGANQKVELAKLASSAHHVTSDDPPLLVFHGREDPVVLVDQSQRIHEVYTSHGLPIDLHILEGEDHGGWAFYTGENRRHVVAFLNKIFHSQD